MLLHLDIYILFLYTKRHKIFFSDIDTLEQEAPIELSFVEEDMRIRISAFRFVANKQCVGAAQTIYCAMTKRTQETLRVSAVPHKASLD